VSSRGIATVHFLATVLVTTVAAKGIFELSETIWATHSGRYDGNSSRRMGRLLLRVKQVTGYRFYDQVDAHRV
jgi:hypothetical protein